MSKLKLKIVTPERITYQSEVDEVVIPTSLGQITVLAQHKPLVAVLKPGELTIKKDGQAFPLAVSTGLIEMRPGNELVILADTAEHVEELDLEKIEAAKKRAEDLIKQKHDLEDIDFARALASLEREMARAKVARRHRHREH